MIATVLSMRTASATAQMVKQKNATLFPKPQTQPMLVYVVQAYNSVQTVNGETASFKSRRQKKSVTTKTTTAMAK
tara:strand:- start:813 stop:1037 length:225 start_codon:yes stop_codon:yes gene_type:complete